MRSFLHPIFSSYCGIVGVILLSAFDVRGELPGPGWLTAAQIASVPPQTSTPTLGRTVDADYATIEIRELARGLDYDPRAIFDYVREHIDYEHYYGCKKGAALTFLERSGNDFDQCALLVSLLGEAKKLPGSPIQDIHYVYGMMTVPVTSASGRDFSHWLGLTNRSSSDFIYLTNIGGWPTSGDDGTPQTGASVKLARVCVEVTLSGVSYLYDPSFKSYRDIPSILPGGINAASGYNYSNGGGLSSQAGGVTSTPSPKKTAIQNINVGQLETYLKGCATNLTNYLHTQLGQSGGASMLDVVGGRNISSAGLDTHYFDLDSRIRTWNPSMTPGEYASIIQIHTENDDWDNTSHSDWTMPIAELRGRRISLGWTGDFTGQSSGLTYTQILLDGVVQATEHGGSLARSVKLTTRVYHPFRNINSGQGDGGHIYSEYGNYVMVYAFKASADLLQQREAKLASLQAKGTADSYEGVTETLNIMGLQWLRQSELAWQLVDRAADSTHINFHRIGWAGNDTSHYLDIRLQLADCQQKQADTDKGQKALEIAQYVASALEHGIVEQTTAGGQAVSTVRLFKDGLLAHAPVVRHDLDNGTLRLYPSDSQFHDKELSFHINKWTGSGYAEVAPGGIAMVISGMYNGGYQVNPVPITFTASLANYISRADFVFPTPVSQPTIHASDPVDVASGAFDYEHVDLDAGGVEPRGYSFSRQYNTRLRERNDAKLGFGWTHNYYLRARKFSDGEVAFGGGTPAQAAAALAGIYAALDFYNKNDVKAWTYTMLVAGWLVDQATNNSVSVQMGAHTLRFTGQPDGTFEAPAGLPLTLTVPTAGGYQMNFLNGNTLVFDTKGRCTKIRDPYNKELTLIYNGTESTSDLKTITDCFGRMLTFTYTGGNLMGISETKDANNAQARSVSFGYDSNGRHDLMACTDPDKKRWTYEYFTNYSQDHRIKKAIDPLNRVIVENTYDLKDRVNQQFSQGDPNKTWTLLYAPTQTIEISPGPTYDRRTFLFDDQHRMVRYVSATGHTIDYTYDGEDRVTSITKPANDITRFEYDLDHNVTSVTDALQKKTQIFYVAHHLDHMIDPRTDSRNHTTNYVVNSHHQLEQITTPENVTTRFTYWPLGSSQNKDGLLHEMISSGSASATTLDYDGYGNVNSVIYPDHTESFNNKLYGDVLTHVLTRAGLGALTTTFDYNYRRQLTVTHLPPVNGVSYVLENDYDDVGNLAQQKDMYGNVTSMSYSSTKKPLVTTFPATTLPSETLTRIYDNRDWLTTTQDNRNKEDRLEYYGDGTISGAFDRLGRKQVSLDYDANSRLWHAGVPQANSSGAFATSTSTYTDRGELWKVQDPAPLSYTTELQNDENGNLLHRINRRTYSWDFTYNGDNQVEDTKSPLGKVWGKRYNDRGLLWTLKEPSTETTTLLYNSMNRVRNSTDPVGSVDLSYDEEGRLDTLTQSGVVLDRDYDPLGRLKKYTHGNDYTLEWIYNDTDALNQHGASYSLKYPDGKQVRYDFDQRGRLSTVTDWATRVTQYQYDDLGRLITTTRPNKTQRIISYDEADQIKSIWELEAGGGLIASYEYPSYWNNGQPQVESSDPGTPAGLQVHQATMTFDHDDRVSTWNGQNVTHDPDGNVTNGPLPAGVPGGSAGFGTLSYDARNRLLAAGTVSNYAYDAENLRTGVTTAAGQTKWVISPAGGPPQPLVRIKPNNGGITRYVWGLGLLYEEDDATQNTYTYHYDRRGSTVALTDKDGHTTDTWTYGPYGEALDRTGSSDTPFRFNGFFGVQTDPNGLLYMNARYYNAELRRFVSVDPMGFAETSNFYAFANGDPVDLADPFGLGATEGAVVSWKNRDGSIKWSAYLSEAFAGVPGYLKENGLSSLRRNLTDPKFIMENFAGGFTLGSALERPFTKLKYAAAAEEIAVATKGIPRITGSGLARVESHLDNVLTNQFGDLPRSTALQVQAGERSMLQRLQEGATSSQDIEFYMHELKESARFRATGNLMDAHNAALEWRGVTSRDLFHPDVTSAHPEIFGSGW